MTYLAAALAAIAFLVPQAASAASLILDVRGSTVHVLADAEGSSLNAFEGSIQVSGASVGQVLLGSSVVPLWVTRPSAGDLRFAGVVPGGYEGSRGELFAFQLAGPAGSAARVMPQDVVFLAGDGRGTQVDVRVAPAAVQLRGDVAAVEDRDPPEFSEVAVSRDAAVFDGDWFVAFNAQDGVTGVARFEVAERAPGFSFGADPGWQPATSPYRLADQSRRSEILVKAVDGAGNEATYRIEAEGGAAGSRYALLAVVAAALLALSFAAGKVRGRRAPR